MLKKFILYISHLMKSELFNFNQAQVSRFTALFQDFRQEKSKNYAA